MYPDMAKNFQTTQGPVAFCMRGHLDLEMDGAPAKERVEVASLEPGDTQDNVTKTEDGYVAHVGIERIHMEEDAGKMNHIGGGEGRIAGATHSLVDYNRSMEEGSLRCDGNVSLRRRGETKLGTKTELKNINSFKSLHDGLAYEICRQAEVLEEGGVIYQETRHWDPSAKRTIVMRVKETADDYRLFPEPDLAPYHLSDEFVENVRKKLPELPDQKAKRFESEFGLSAYDARHLVEHRTTANFFEACMNTEQGAQFVKPIANLIINDVAAYLNAHPEITTLDQTALTPERAVALVELMQKDTISSKQGKEVFAAILDEDKDPKAIIAERGMEQVSDTGAIEGVIDGVLAAFPDKVEQYKGGKTGLLGFFVGQCMKEMKGQGNPKVINELLSKKLGE